MLKYRVLTAIVLIPIVIGVLYYSSPFIFAILCALVILAAAWEWSALTGLRGFIARIAYLALVAIGLFALAYWQRWPLLVNYIVVFSLAVLWWCYTLIGIFYFPNAPWLWGKAGWVRSLLGLFILLPCWLALVAMQRGSNGANWLMFMLLLIWGADTGAYFTGRWFGKHKLAPAVSPGKTWEGVYGAVFVVAILSAVAIPWFALQWRQWPALLVLSLGVVLFSIIGDLNESVFKRLVGAKDSGNLLPGHGGLLDRIDSLTAAAPFFALGLLLLNS